MTSVRLLCGAVPAQDLAVFDLHRFIVGARLQPSKAGIPRIGASTFVE